jgi:hypothetical protein
MHFFGPGHDGIEQALGALRSRLATLALLALLTALTLLTLITRQAAVALWPGSSRLAALTLRTRLALQATVTRPTTRADDAFTRLALLAARADRTGAAEATLQPALALWSWLTLQATSALLTALTLRTGWTRGAWFSALAVRAYLALLAGRPDHRVTFDALRTLLALRANQAALALRTGATLPPCLTLLTLRAGNAAQAALASLALGATFTLRADHGIAALALRPLLATIAFDAARPWRAILERIQARLDIACDHRPQLKVLGAKRCDRLAGLRLDHLKSALPIAAQLQDDLAASL